MKKILRRLKKIQWRLTFTYMAATLVMLFLVELLVLVSNNRNAFSNPFFINSIARSLAESSRNLGAALDSPYDFEAIHDWVQSNKPLTRAQPPPEMPTNPRPAQTDLSIRINLFQSKPVPYSQDQSRLVVSDPQGWILAADNEQEFPPGDNLLDYLDQSERDNLDEIMQGVMTSLVYSTNSSQYASFSFPVYRAGQMQAIIFMRIVAPTMKEEFLAAFEGFLPDLPVFLFTSILVGFVFGSLLASGFTRRIQNLIEFTSRWGRGDFSRIDNIREGDEIGELSLALNQMVARLAELIEGEKQLAVLEERNRFARDLHDSVKQQIFSISMNLGAIKTIMQTNPKKAADQLDITADIAKQARNELSALIYTLMPAQLEQQALELALQEYIHVWEKNSGISVVYRSLGSKKEIDQETEQSIFRIVQEALANISRHSKATATSVMLEYAAEFLKLQVSDNGIGYDPHTVKKGLGLRSISERVAENGGEMEVDSGESGTTITLRFPYKSSHAGGGDEKSS